MKNQLQRLLQSSIDQLNSSGEFTLSTSTPISIERTRDKSHGDYASNLALAMSKQARCKPRDLAAKIVANLPNSDLIKSCDIAGPGFINFTLTEKARLAVIEEVMKQGEGYGRSNIGVGKKVQVEFVSANPTGPLHVGHGRGAAYGSTVADLLSACGFEVQREYYVNDAGRQMDILATSIWLRYLDLCGEEFTFPANGYQGDYVWDIAANLHRNKGDRYRKSSEEVFSSIPDDEPDGGDKEVHIDALIERSKNLLGSNEVRNILDAGLETILGDIRQDLEEFGVSYDRWYSERSLVDSGAVDRALERLEKGGYIYEKGGALWFRSSDFGDEKDRVVVRDNGIKTYFASDIAYHMEKLERGFDMVIDVWGADHHGYVPRVKAALKALGDNPDQLDVLLVQFAVLYRGGEKVPMSTRSGQFVTLRELREEVGSDSARFFYVMRKCEQHMDFDLDLAKSQSSDNPIYYIQYAHARICSVMRQLKEKGFEYDKNLGLEQLSLLTETHEEALLTSLSRYPELVEASALNHEPHVIAHFLRDIANELHTYYNAHQFLIDDQNLRSARITLALAIRQVISNGLKLLGLSAPEQM